MPELEANEAMSLIVVANPEAPAALQALAAQYWDLIGIDTDQRAPLWRFNVATLDFSLWSGMAYYAAAAGATASTADYSCEGCGGTLTLISRQSLLDVMNGHPVLCRKCNTHADEQALKVISGEGFEKRSAKLRQRDMIAAVRDERSIVEARRRDYIESTYPVLEADPTELVDNAPLFARVGLLSTIYGTGDEGGVIVGVELRGESIGPSYRLSRELFFAAQNTGLLQVHPSTPSAGFVWDDGTSVPTGSIYAGKVRYMAGGSGTVSDRLSDMVDAAEDRVRIEDLGSAPRRELRTLVHRVVAGEAARYLTAEMGALRLPSLTEKNNEALDAAAQRGAAAFSLGHLYGFAWRAARDASSAYLKNSGMSAEKAITHGLRKYETYIQAALDDPTSTRAPFEESAKVPLSAVTTLLFNDVLGLNPMKATPAAIDAAFALPLDVELAALCDAGIPSHSELMERIRSSGNEWTAAQFRTVLARLEDWSPELCAPLCAHGRVGPVSAELGRVYDRTVNLLGNRVAAIATAEASGVANSVRYGIRTGDALLAEVIRRLDVTDVAPEVTFF